MTEKTTVNELTLAKVERQFGLQEVTDPAWFSEWQDDLSPISASLHQLKQEVKSSFMQFVKSHSRS